MKFNKKLTLAVTGALLAISSPTHAEINTLSDFLQADAPFKKDFSIADHDASVQFYGIVDIGYGYADHALPINYNLPQGFYPGLRQSSTYTTSQSDWFSGGLSQNRVGIKADANLFQLGDSNVKAVLNLETGFNPLGFELYNGAKSLVQNSGLPSAKNQSISNESSQNGQLFNRAENAGFSFDQYGTVTFGLNTNTFKDIISTYDPVNADNFSALGQSGTIGGSGGVSENQRLQNSLKYTNTIATPSIPLEEAKVNVGAVYQWGNDINLNYGYGYATQIGFESKSFGIQAGYNRFSDAISATNSSTVGDISAKAYNTHGWLVAARINPVPELKISGGWEQFTRNQATDTNIQYGDLWGYNLDNSSRVAQGFSTVGETQQFNVFFLGAGYDFGPRFPTLAGLKLQAGYYDYLNEHPQGVASNALSGRAGTWASVVNYQINKRFDVYAAITDTHFTGTYYAGYDANQLVVGTGLRIKL
jgi:predicted porin